MLAQVSRYAGVFVAASWLMASAVAAPVRFSDDSDFRNVSPTSPAVTDRIDPSPSSTPESAPQTPQPSKQSSDDDVLDIAGGAPDAARSARTNIQTFNAPVVDNSPGSIPVQIAAPISLGRDKPQDVAASAAPSAQTSSNLVAHQQLSPLVIATPEPGSVGLLVIASTVFLARRRSSKIRPR